MAARSRSIIYRKPWMYELVMRLLYGRHYEQRYRSLAALIPSRASVVEVCCGPAVLYRRHLASRGIHYLGLDLSPAFVRELRAGGVEARVWDLRSSERLPSADYVVMQASLYQFMSNAHAIIDRMLEAASVQVIVSEPIRNVSSSGAIGRQLARLANPGDGVPVDRYTDETLGQVFEPFRARVERSFLLPGGRERAYVLNARSDSSGAIMSS